VIFRFGDQSTAGRRPRRVNTASAGGGRRARGVPNDALGPARAVRSRVGSMVRLAALGPPCGEASAGADAP